MLRLHCFHGNEEATGLWLPDQPPQQSQALGGADPSGYRCLKKLGLCGTNVHLAGFKPTTLHRWDTQGDPAAAWGRGPQPGGGGGQRAHTGMLLLLKKRPKKDQSFYLKPRETHT